MDKSPSVFLLHIRDAITQIEVYVDGYTYAQFVVDKKTQDAVIRQLEVIGEATTNLEDVFKRENATIPWREISDFRNVLSHEYWDVDLDIVWNAAHEDVRTLKDALLPLIETN